MNEPKQYVIDFIEGKIATKDFVNRLHADDSLYGWMQSIVPKGKLCHVGVKQEDGRVRGVAAPYDIRTVVEFLWNMGGSRSGCELDVHSSVAELYKEAFPSEEIKVDTQLKTKFSFLLDAIPDYVDSVEAEESGIFERYFAELPENASKTARTKMFRERVKEDFHLEGKKYPRWIQSSEWPFNNGKPMKFLRQETLQHGELTKYYFEDVDTNEQRVIIQSF